MNMHRFLIVIEDAGENYSAYSPDLPGCVATGATREETEQNMYGAIQMHIEGLVDDAGDRDILISRKCLLLVRLVDRRRLAGFCLRSRCRFPIRVRSARSLTSSVAGEG